eukprot:5599875-Alexandrium_andersonii.AAC.1
MRHTLKSTVRVQRFRGLPKRPYGFAITTLVLRKRAAAFAMAVERAGVRRCTGNFTIADLAKETLN